MASQALLDWSTTITNCETVDEFIGASMTYERNKCTLVGISENLKYADNTKTVKIKPTLNIIFSNNKY